MSYLIQWMMSVRRILNQIADSSANSRDQIVGGDCSAVDRVWALYSVDGLLSYDLFYFLYFVALCSCFLYFIYGGIMVFVGGK